MTGYPFSLRGVLRGLTAVLVLFTSAADHYLSALAGTHTVAWCTRQITTAIRETYRFGRYGPPSTRTDIQPIIIDAEIVD
jgi:hypothetical protein